MEIHLHKRIDQLGHSAEEYLEEIPTELSFDEMAASDFLPIYHQYEECMEYISILRSEVEYGKSLEEIYG